ncbi:MAG TPA: amidohydrolase family protein [Actinocatenispora sp.]
MGYDEVWEQMIAVSRIPPAVPADGIVDLSHVMFRLHNLVGDTLIHEYREEAQHILLSRERERAALINVLLSDTTSVATVVEIAGMLRLPLDGRSSWWPPRHSSARTLSLGSTRTRRGGSGCDGSGLGSSEWAGSVWGSTGWCGVGRRPEAGCERRGEFRAVPAGAGHGSGPRGQGTARHVRAVRADHHHRGTRVVVEDPPHEHHAVPPDGGADLGVAMIFDVHAHVMVHGAAQQARERAAGVTRSVLLGTRVHLEAAATLAEVRAEFDRLGEVIGGTAVALDTYHAVQAELRDRLAEQPQRYVGFAGAPIGLPADEQVEVLAAALDGMVGIGELTPPPDRAELIEPALTVAADHGGLPVLVHGFAPTTARDLATYARLATRYAGVPVIVGAFGGLNWPTLLDLALATPNLYLDLASAIQVFGVRAAVTALPERCLFGSNTPYGDVVAARHTVEAAVTDPAVRALVFGGNLTALIKE